MRSSASFNYKLVQMHMTFDWFVLRYASCRRQIEAGAPVADLAFQLEGQLCQ